MSGLLRSHHARPYTEFLAVPGPGRLARPAPAGRGGLAGRRAPRERREEVLPLEPPARRHARDHGGADQGALGVRAAAPAAQGRAGARPLRGPELARAAPPRAPVPARLRLPAAPAARGEKGPRPRPSPARHPRRACPPSADGSWPRSPACSCAVRIVGSTSSATSGSEGGGVVLETITNLLWIYPTCCRRRNSAGTVRYDVRGLL